MNHDNIKVFKELFGSKTDNRKILLIIFLIQNDKNFLKELRFSKK